MSIQLKSDGKNKQVRIEKDGVVISSIFLNSIMETLMKFVHGRWTSIGISN